MHNARPTAGFTNVKVVDGGCDAYFKAFPESKQAKRG